MKFLVGIKLAITTRFNEHAIFVLQVDTHHYDLTLPNFEHYRLHQYDATVRNYLLYFVVFVGENVKCCL